MREAISSLDEFSVFLGNEPLSATCPAEGHYLSMESLCLLKLKRARGIWVTHLFELFDDAINLNEFMFGALFTFMHVHAAGNEREYIVQPGIPDKFSGARDL